MEDKEEMGIQISNCKFNGDVSVDMYMVAVI